MIGFFIGYISGLAGFAYGLTHPQIIRPAASNPKYRTEPVKQSCRLCYGHMGLNSNDQPQCVRCGFAEIGGKP